MFAIHVSWVRFPEDALIENALISKNLSIHSSVVEYLPSKQGVRVRFPVNAWIISSMVEHPSVQQETGEEDSLTVVGFLPNDHSERFKKYRPLNDNSEKSLKD